MSDRDDDDRIAPDTPPPTPDGPPEAEPAGPAEVVSPGRSPFGFRGLGGMGGARTPGAPRSGRPVGSLVRIGLVLLATLGAVTLYFGVTTVADPEQAICTQARVILEDESDDDDFDADDVECVDAVAQVEQMEDEDLSSESTVRTTGFIVSAIGLGQLVGGALTLRARARGPRLVALFAAGLGIIFPVLGFVSMAVLLFVVYAIFFSADARAVFGDPRTRRQPPPAG